MADILIVEDETAINELIRRNLELVGHRCVSVYDGEEAIRRLQEGQFDLMLLDIMLPGADGFEVYQTAEHVPTIFLTAKGGLSDRVRGLRMGADDYIVKPFEILELLVRMEKVLERTNKLSQTIKILNMEINFEEHSVKQNGQEVILKPKEFELLSVLAKNKNIAISRENLLRMVWGIEYMGETRTVDVHIGQLRKKLGLADHIKTISKIGYRLEE